MDYLFNKTKQMKKPETNAPAKKTAIKPAVKKEAKTGMKIVHRSKPKKEKEKEEMISISKKRHETMLFYINVLEESIGSLLLELIKVEEKLSKRDKSVKKSVKKST